MSESPLLPLMPHPEVNDSKQELVVSGKLARIIIHNDEVTPYEYVIFTLGDIFMLSEEIADHIAWTAHTKGSAVVVVRPRIEAEKLVKIAAAHAKVDGFPLTFSLETD
jgi:ATP-dependent Clp protease adaptor protein ClpS